jgi:hypothetical protein
VRIGTAGQVFVDVTNVDPWTSYQIQSSPSPAGGWTLGQTFRTGDGTAAYGHTWEDQNATGASRFYRLSWTLLR